MSWSTRITTASLCSGMRRITSLRCAVSASGSPAAGSSSSTRRGRPTSARATSTSRRSRAPSVPTRACGPASIPTSEIAPSTSARRDFRAEPRVLVDDRDVVVDRELLDRLLGLEGTAHAPPGTAVVSHLQQVLAERGDRARGRLHEAADDVEERCLAGAVGPDQPARAVLELDVHPVEWRDAAEPNRQVGDLDHFAALPLDAEPLDAPADRAASLAMSFGNWSAMPAGAVVSTCRTPTPNRIVASRSTRRCC